MAVDTIDFYNYVYYLFSWNIKLGSNTTLGFKMKPNIGIKSHSSLFAHLP